MYNIRVSLSLSLAKRTRCEKMARTHTKFFAAALITEQSSANQTKELAKKTRSEERLNIKKEEKTTKKKIREKQNQDVSRRKAWPMKRGNNNRATTITLKSFSPLECLASLSRAARPRSIFLASSFTLPFRRFVTSFLAIHFFPSLSSSTPLLHLSSVFLPMRRGLLPPKTREEGRGSR